VSMVCMGLNMFDQTLVPTLVMATTRSPNCKSCFS
jgi:hypothetical protein